MRTKTPPHLAILILFLAFFGVYQFASTVIEGRGLEANALRGLFVFTNEKDVQNSSSSFALSSTTTQERFYSEDSEAFIAPQITAKAAVVMNVKNGKILYQNNATTQLPLASLTKVMSALVADSLFSDDQAISIPLSAISVTGQSHFHAGEKWKFRDLLNYSLVTSSNDGIAAIAETAYPEKGDDRFVDEMNNKTSEIGLPQTYFLNPTGLDNNNTMSGAYSSAMDVAALLTYVYRHQPHLLDATAQKSITVVTPSGKTYTGHNTNEHVSDIPGLLASKTGFTDLAGGNLAVIWNAGLSHPIIIVVLGSTREERFTDVEKLIQATIQYFGPKHS